jgi:hypothetical protein
MKRSLLFLCLCAAAPVLVCAQENKPTNCRTLEVAGNFVGPDEIIVNGMVCPKPAKPETGAQTKGAPETVAPVPTAAPVVATPNTEPIDVVSAAKAANIRVEAAKEAIKAAQEAAESSLSTLEQQANPSDAALPTQPAQSQSAQEVILATNPEVGGATATEQISDPVAADAAGAFADAIGQMVSRDPQPEDPTASSDTHKDAAPVDPQRIEEAKQLACTKVQSDGTPNSVSKCMELLGQIVDDIGKL